MGLANYKARLQTHLFHVKHFIFCLLVGSVLQIRSFYSAVYSKGVFVVLIKTIL